MKPKKVKSPKSENLKDPHAAVKVCLVIFAIFLVSRAIVLGSIFFLHEGPFRVSSYTRWISKEAVLISMEPIDSLLIRASSPEEQDVQVYLNGENVSVIHLTSKQSAFLVMCEKTQQLPIEIRLEAEHSSSPSPDGKTGDTRRLSWLAHSLAINADPHLEIVAGRALVNNDRFIKSGIYDVEQAETAQLKTLHEYVAFFDTALYHWDFGWYQSVVDNGYSWDPNPQTPNNVAFLYLYPLLSFILKTVTGMPSRAALITVNVLLTYASMVLLYYLTLRITKDPKKSFTSPVLLAFYPYNVFLTSGFGEGAFMFFTLLAILMLLDKKYIGFGLAAGALSAIRQNGLIAPIVLVIDYFLIQKNKLNLKNLSKVLGLSVLSLWGFITDSLYKWFLFHDGLVSFKAVDAWRAKPTNVFRHLFYIFVNSLKSGWLTPEFLGMVFFYIVIIFILYIAIREKCKLDRPDWIIVLFCMGFLGVTVLMYVFNNSSSITCMGRYIFAACPVLALMSKKEWIHKSYMLGPVIGIFVFYLGIMSIRFSYGMSPI